MQHIWITRAKCNTCGYFWTNPGSPNVVCACGASSIFDNIITAGNEVLDDAEFELAVAADLGINVNALELIRG